MKKLKLPNYLEVFFEWYFLEWKIFDKLLKIVYNRTYIM